jgi:DNA polymerase-1
MSRLEYDESKLPIFNPRSTQQVARVLQHLGVELTKKTKTGFSTDDSVLFDLKGTHPFVDKLIEYRELYKQYSTYLCPLLEKSNDEDSSVYPRFNQTSVSDERLSSSDPNIQNITKHSETGKQLRKCFVAKPGHVLIANDYSQLHLRILAHYSKDPTMVDAYNRNLDLHQLTADMLQVPRNPVAKTINFGIVYSVSPKSLAQQLHEQGHDIPVERAATIIEEFFVKYYGVREWRNHIIAYAKHYGYAPSLGGFRVPLPFINETGRGGRPTKRAWHEERKAVNSPILTTEAQIVKNATREIYEGYKLVPLWQIHDDLTYEVPETEVETHARRIKAIMESCNPLCVPLKVDQKIARNWGEL